MNLNLYNDLYLPIFIFITTSYPTYCISKNASSMLYQISNKKCKLYHYFLNVQKWITLKHASKQ